MRHQARQLIRLHGPSALWITGALAVILFAVSLAILADNFGYDLDVVDMPVATLVALLVTAGGIYFAAVVAAKTLEFATPFSNPKIALGVMIAAGLAARLILFSSQPALEDDYQRYLWDGAVTAHGFNPFAISPSQVIDGGPGHSLAEIAKASGPVLERINHRNLTTIYPPLAQAAFALAHLIKPYSLASWRSLLLVADIATLGLIFALLGLLNKSPLWATVYWWNPVVLKEFFNSVHMDALLLPFVMGALYLALKSRPVAATAALACAVGTKLWPVLLLPLIWRQAIKNRGQLIQCGVVFALLITALSLPYLSAGLGENSGTVAYVQRWTINSPLFTSLRSLLEILFAGLSTDSVALAATSARIVLAGAVSVLAVLMALRPIKDASDLLSRTLVIVAALILLAPAIYPWYALWMLPLLALFPYTGLVLVSATIPLYYCYFYFAARDATHLYQTIIVWIVWVPVWLLCAKDMVTVYRTATGKTEKPNDLTIKRT